MATDAVCGDRFLTVDSAPVLDLVVGEYIALVAYQGTDKDILKRSRTRAKISIESR